MFNVDYIAKEDIKERYSNWPQIPGHPYRILISIEVLVLEKQMYC